MSNFKKYIHIFSIAIFICFFSACAGKKIIIDCYSAPKEYKKIEGLRSDFNSAKKFKFLSIAIYPKIESQIRGRDIITLEKLLISDVKEKITELNFITLEPIFETSPNRLNLQIIDYQYRSTNNETSNEIECNLVVNFVIRRGATEYYAKSYSAKENRYAKSKQGLPGKDLLLKEMSKQCAASFVKDISPLKTKQLRELKSLPGDIEYVIDYAIIRNYEGAIEAMEKYTGKKDMNFYYNLAVFYEALAGEKENLTLLEKANKNYILAMENGGAKNDLVISSKARFDIFFNLFSKVESQKNDNKELEEHHKEVLY